MLKDFFVFMCPKCRHFTNAPVGQKKRRCSYCGKIIDIMAAQKALFDSPEAAAAAVREFNASKGGDEFKQAVEKSLEKVRGLIPSEKVDPKSLVGSKDVPSTGKGKRLLTMLEKEAREPCSLERIEKLCPKYRLDWTWVEEQLNKLANRGQLIFPRPWTVQLVQTGSSKKKKQRAVDVSKDIVKYLKKLGGKANYHALVDHFTDIGISPASIDSSLDRLVREGSIYRPRADEVSLL